MSSSGLNITDATSTRMPQLSPAADTNKKNLNSAPENSQESTSDTTNNSGEIYKKIQALTDNGTYSVNFETDSTTGKMVIRIVNTTTQEVVRQIPPEAVLGMDAALEKFQGTIVDKKI